MDIAQVALFVVIIILAILLIILGVQVFFILQEFRKTVSKANKVLEHTENITQSVSSPIAALSNLASSIKTGRSIVSLFKRFISKDENSGKKNKGE